MTNTLLRAPTACIRLIIVILMAAFPGLVFAQNDASAHTLVGNAPMEMFFVPSGLCMTDSEQTTLKNFYISKQPVTWQLWNEIMGTRSGGVSSDSLPVSNVSRDEVELFILWLNQKTGMQYRLPTETEWACAVRTGLLSGDTPSFYRDGNVAATGFRLAMDDPKEVRAAEAALRLEQERLAAEKAAADLARKAEQERLATDKTEAQKSIVQQLRTERRQQRQNRLDALLSSVFFTINAAYTPMPQWSYGFKVGTVKFLGWYFCAMTNFNYKGAFTTFSPNNHYVLTGNSRTTYLGGQLGLVVRPVKNLSIHIGAGFGYRTLNFESDQGWRNFPKRTYYGPTASAGIMLYIKNVVLSAEATGMAYNLNKLNETRYTIGAQVGVGYSFPLGQ